MSFFRAEGKRFVVDEKEFCARFEALLKRRPKERELFRRGRELVRELLADTRWAGEILTRIILDPAYLDRQPPSVFPNEVIVHRSPERFFSLLIYLWEPESLCAVHDHSSWGIIGPLFGSMREIRYRRADDGSTEGFAELEEVSSSVIDRGKVRMVLPLEKGIHRTGSAGKWTAVSVGVYGPSVRKGYIQLFDPARKSVSRAYPPRSWKRALAREILNEAPDVWADELARIAEAPP
ncbi:MAG TPA: cysteine dioxygenase family protein [Thermodesulfobacteriota bacterium]|nr:cysteine dioxygenase family protein [Thermodesulfobacteriota bacterium]